MIVPYPIPLLRGYCEYVTDADTLRLRVDGPFYTAITVSVRLRGVDAPELSTPEGKDARDMVRALIEGQPVLLTPFKDRQSFARWIGDVQYYEPTTEAWLMLSDWLVDRGLAVRI